MNQSSNFSFLKNTFPKILPSALEAEKLARTSPRPSITTIRICLERLVHWLYQHDADIDYPPVKASLFELMDASDFKAIIQPKIYDKMHLLRKAGNRCAHPSPNMKDPKPAHAIALLEELHHVLYWAARIYHGLSENLVFQPKLLPSPHASQNELNKKLAELEAKSKELQEQEEALHEKRKADEAAQQAWEAERRANKEQRVQASQEPDPHDYKEHRTREALVDALLVEAGWDPEATGVTQVQIDPNQPQAVADYLFNDASGKPLLLVDTRTYTRNHTAGLANARENARLLGERHGQEPFVYCSDGHETWLVDATSSRPVLAIRTREDLERLRYVTAYGQSPHVNLVTSGIIDGRDYQREAVQAVAERFISGQRRGLLVLATGTGKTRVAVAIMDMLSKAKQVKRTLFLVDRIELGNQAYRAIKSHLPHATPSILRRETINKLMEHQQVITTYQTLLNQMDKLDGTGKRLLSPGHFDLIICDEAHRSIYNRYNLLLRYFDGFLLGLTATPKEEVGRQTYDVFDCPSGTPTYDYDLKQGVREGYLVGYRPILAQTHFQSRGLHYDDLTPEDKIRFEETFDTENANQGFSSQDFNRFIFNKGTILAVLDNILQNGIKVDGGDLLAKTILFAANHKHAVTIHKLFREEWSHLDSEFATVIDHESDPDGSALNRFRDEEKIRLAISVDKLDTGIDIPAVSNLVFFKIIRSLSKFWQMVGRGTRLCPDLFGPGDHKKEFLIFDHCDNFAFFKVKPKGRAQSQGRSQRQRLAQERFKLALNLGKETNDSPLRKKILDRLHQDLSSIPRDNLQVRQNIDKLQPLYDRQHWDTLNEDDNELMDLVGALPLQAQSGESQQTRDFDLLITKIQQAQTSQNQKALEDHAPRLQEMAAQLLDQTQVNAIRDQEETLHALHGTDYLQKASLEDLEAIRQNIKPLVSYVKPRIKRQIYHTDLQDGPMFIRDMTEEHGLQELAPYELNSMRQQIEEWLKSQRDSLIPLRKLYRNQPITSSELEQLEQHLYHSSPIGSEGLNSLRHDRPLGQFVRECIGLDRDTLQRELQTYIKDYNFNSRQEAFLKYLVDYLCEKGMIEPARLYEGEFAHIHEGGPDDLFAESAEVVEGIFHFVKQVNANAGGM